MQRRIALLIIATTLAGALPGCRAVRARLHRHRSANPPHPAVASSPARSNAAANADAGHSRPPPDTITVRLGSPGTGEPLPLDLAIDAQRPRVIVDSPYQAWSDEGTFVHLVAIAPDLHPCDRADVYAGNRHIGRTDEHGSFAFRRTPPAADEHGEHHGDANAWNRLSVICHANGRHYVATAAYNAFARTSSFERPIVYVYADRGVYNPGQTIHARAIAWRLRGEYVPVANETVTLSLRREDGTALGGGPLTSDEYGTGSLDLALPEHLAEGRYTLVATSGEQTAESQIRVQRFVPPVIEVQHTLGEFLTPAMNEIAFDVNLHYFDGAQFTAGHVRLNANVNGQEFTIAQRDVTGAGPHRFVVPRSVLDRARSQLDDGERMDVNIAVSDHNGRSDTVHRALRFARNPYTATIELDRTEYAPGERVDATVRVVDLNHVVVRAKHVTLRGLAHAMEGTTDQDGVVHFRFEMPHGSQAIHAYVDDVSDAIADGTLSVSEVHPMQSTVAQTRLREHEPVDVTVRFPANVVPVESVVHADVVDSSGAIIDVFEIPIDRSGHEPVGRARFDAPSWGSMLLTLFTSAAPREHANDASAVGLVTDGQNVAVVPGASLDITLDPLPAEARPGEHVHVSAHVTRDGRPVDARVGAAVVDQAVISLLDPLEHDPHDRFYNPQEKVLASTGAQTLTWPVVQRNWGTDRYDIGWPYSFGFHPSSDPAQDRWPVDEVESGPLTLRALLGNGRRLARQQVAQQGIFAALGAPGGGMAGGGSGIVSPFGGLTESGVDNQNANGNMTGDAIGDAFGYGGLGATGTGWGGGGTGEGTIGLGNIGTMGHGSGRGMARPQPQLVMRTNFAETAAWLPSLDVREGTLAFDVDLPDSITRQQISLVATDRAGGIAVQRAEIPVRQGFYVRSDLPPVLVEGDRTQVTLAARNLTDAPMNATVVLRSDDLAVRETGTSAVTLEPRGTATDGFEVTAMRPGRATYHFDGTSAAIVDRGERTLYVEPAGVPVRSHEEGAVHAGEDFALTFDDAGDRYAVHTLSIAFPTAVGLEDVLGSADSIVGGDMQSVAAELDVAVSLLSVRELAHGDRSTREIRSRAARALIAVLSAANTDGGFGWWWGARSNASVTAFVLDVLNRAHHANLPVPRAAMIAAGAYLARAIQQHTLAESRELVAWEGDGDRVRDVLLAESAAALASLPPEMRQDDVTEALESARHTLRTIATRSSASPLELAHALRALTAMDGGGAVRGATDSIALASRLSAARRDRHWEPGWFDAFGGGIETTAVALEALTAAHAADGSALAHDAVEYLLSTRRSWGAWHNVRGTAWAIRALSQMTLGTEREGAHVHAEIDGRVVADTTIDTRDPWTATLALRQIELTDLARGPHRLTVRYDGALAPIVSVDHTRWGANGAVGEAGAPAITLLAPSSTRSEAPMELGFHVGNVRRASLVRVSIPVPPYADPDAASLRALVANGTITGFEIGSRAIEIVIANPLPDTTARFTVRMPRAGHYTLTGAWAMTDGGARGDAQAVGVDVM